MSAVISAPAPGTAARHVNLTPAAISEALTSVLEKSSMSASLEAIVAAVAQRLAAPETALAATPLRRTPRSEIYTVTDGRQGRRYCLKIYRGQDIEKRLRCESAAYAFMKETGALRTPDILAQDAGWLLMDYLSKVFPVDPYTMAADIAHLHAVAPEGRFERQPEYHEKGMQRIESKRQELEAALPDFKALWSRLRHRHPEPELATVHGDFHSKNAIRCGDGLHNYIDVELVKESCKYKDLGLLAISTGLSQEGLLTAYSRTTGQRVLRDHLRHLAYETALIALNRHSILAPPLGARQTSANDDQVLYAVRSSMEAL